MTLSSVSGDIMTIIASTALSAAEPFTPKWIEGPGAPIFLIRAGDVIERELFEAILSGPVYNAGEVWPWEKHGALVEGIAAIGGEDAPQLIALAEASMQEVLADPQEKALLAQVTALVAQHFPPYRALVEQDIRRRGILPVAAFCRYCTGWENVDAEMKRGVDGMIDASAIATIDPIMLRSAGMEAYNRQYGISARKNSASPLKSGDDQETSPSADASAKDGSSAESDTPKTPD